MSPRGVAAVVFALAAGALAAGAGFDLDPFDSAELALVAATRGLGHPPGQPLHTLLGWLVTRGPWRPLTALTWLSIAPAAAMFALAAARGTATRSLATWRAVAVVAVALVPCALRTVRETACRVEVYALAAALAAEAVFVAPRRSARSDALTGALLGLAAATNPVIAAQGGGALWLALRHRRGARVAAFLRIAASGVLGLAPYAYAWAVARRGAVTMVWSPPHDVASFVAMVSARDFQANVSITGATFLRNLVHVVADVTRSGTLPFVALGLWGVVRDRGDRAPDDPAGDAWLPLAIACGGGVMMLAANVVYRGAIPDFGGYFLVALGLASVGAVQLAADPTRGTARAAGIAAAGIAAVALGQQGATLGPPAGATRALAAEVLRDAPPGAIVVLASDHLVFPALYLQLAEGLRADVTILNTGWASSAWAWQLAMARDPRLVVDLTPGRGGTARLAAALRMRPAGRAVLAETLPLLGLAAQGGVCPRGLAWASPEGCGAAQAGAERGQAALRREAARAARGSWDARLVLYTARSLGRDALALGCPGLAARYYSAGLAREVPAWARARACDGRRPGVGPSPDVLTIAPADVDRELARVAP